jgi:hypothetical protein
MQQAALTDLRSSCFIMVYRNLEMAPSVGIVRFLRRLAILLNSLGMKNTMRRNCAETVRAFSDWIEDQEKVHNTLRIGYDREELLLSGQSEKE